MLGIVLSVLLYIYISVNKHIGTGSSSLFYRKLRCSIESLNNLPKDIQLLKLSNQALNSDSLALEARCLIPALYCLHILLHKAANVYFNLNMIHVIYK